MRAKYFPQIIALLLTLGTTTQLQAASTIQFTSYNYTVAEDSGSVNLTVQRSGDTNTVVSVDYATTNLTATAGLKYTAVSGTLEFAAGVTNQAIVVPILNEGFIEGTKTFQVILSNPTGGGELGPRSYANVSITDNDKGLQFEFGPSTFGSYRVGEGEGFILLGVTRGDDGNFPVSVDFATSDGTATNGVHYTATNGTLTFAPGQKLALFTVPILNNGVKEANKTFRATLSNPINQLLGAQTLATVTIVDNDPGVQFEYSQYWLQENEGALTVKVLRGNDVDLPLFTVDFATSNLTAVAGQDYTETTGTLTFTVGETVKTITVPITYDEQLEADENFTLTLSNPSGGIVLGSNTRATITLLDTTGMAAHRYDRINVLPDQSVQLTLGGGVHKRFKDYFDLYPIEVSTNLVDWTPLVTLQRTNSSNNAFTYTDRQAGTSVMRFYRTVTNNLITAMLKPTGPHAVGMVNRWLTDPTRRNRFGVSTNGSFMASIWYPAMAESGKLPISCEDQALWHDPGWLGPFSDREPYFVSHAVPNAKCSTEGSPYPVVLFSHGLGAFRFQAAEKAENLASHGYILVAVDHFDAETPVFSDGTVAKLPSSTTSTAGFEDRVRDLSFVLDEMVKWNRDEPMFAGCFDLTQVAAMGFSWGGGVVAELCRVDSRCRAAIVLDPSSGNGGQEPLLQINNSGNSDGGLFAYCTKDAIWFQISSTEHLNFSDFYWWSFPNNLEAAREAARTVNAYTLWFLNKYLKGSTDPMPALKDYPRIINFKQK